MYPIVLDVNPVNIINHGNRSNMLIIDHCENILVFI